jgi:hypothetical protein
MRPSRRIPRSNATWRRFLMRAHLATDQKLVVQKQAQVRWLFERLKNEDRSPSSSDTPPSPDELADET